MSAKFKLARYGYQPVHTTAQIHEAIRRREAGEKLMMIAMEMGTTESWVSRVTAGRVQRGGQ